MKRTEAVTTEWTRSAVTSMEDGNDAAGLFKLRWRGLTSPIVRRVFLIGCIGLILSVVSLNRTVGADKDVAMERPQAVTRQARGGDNRGEADRPETMSGLRLQIERLGPFKSLAVVTINGALTADNVDVLAETLDTLTQQRVFRVIIRWADSASEVEPAIVDWLRESARCAGTGNPAKSRLPHLPPSLNSLQLVDIPSTSPQAGSDATDVAAAELKEAWESPNAGTLTEAITVALEPVYRNLSRDRLLRQIETGPLATRVAALTIGGSRLPPESLPLVLACTRRDDVELQNAALIALRHFSEKEAIDTLLRFARRNTEPLATTAVISLATSRYPVGHHAALQLLESAPAALCRKIANVFATFPRSEWSEPLYRFATNDDCQFQLEALRALVLVGHTQLNALLRETLATSRDAALRQQAFEALYRKTDSQSEEAALSYVLEQLEHAPATEAMIELIERTRDQRAVRPLLEHLEADRGSRLVLIHTLAQIGDETTAADLVRLYPRLTGNEKAEVLNSLVAMRSSQFLVLAPEALKSSDGAVISAVCQGLQFDASNAAVRLLANALKTSTHSTTWSFTCTALASIGTPSARTALNAARDDSMEAKRDYAIDAIRQLYETSPAMHSLRMARQAEEQRDWEKAVSEYDTAIAADPLHPDAFAGRGNAHLRLRQWNQARTDFDSAVTLDSYNLRAVAGIAFLHVLNGDWEAGIRRLEAARQSVLDEEGGNIAAFAYNAARVYSHAFQLLKRNNKPNQADQAESFRQAAFSELQRAVDLGCPETREMDSDPDLAALRDSKEFRRLVERVRQKTDAGGFSDDEF